MLRATDERQQVIAYAPSKLAEAVSSGHDGATFDRKGDAERALSLIEAQMIAGAPRATTDSPTTPTPAPAETSNTAPTPRKPRRTHHRGKRPPATPARPARSLSWAYQLRKGTGPMDAQPTGIGERLRNVRKRRGLTRAYRELTALGIIREIPGLRYFGGRT